MSGAYLESALSALREIDESREGRIFNPNEAAAVLAALARHREPAMTSGTPAQVGSRAPTPEQMESAAEWLDYNEGEGEELESCKVVAAWLRQQASAKDLRIAAKANGVSVKALRAALGVSP
jgi:hypothetical protein